MYSDILPLLDQNKIRMYIRRGYRKLKNVYFEIKERKSRIDFLKRNIDQLRQITIVKSNNTYMAHFIFELKDPEKNNKKFSHVVGIDLNKTGIGVAVTNIAGALIWRKFYPIPPLPNNKDKIKNILGKTIKQIFENTKKFKRRVFVVGSITNKGLFTIFPFNN